jgi:RimJ/RimL family protein N-acetyltransferase
MDWPIALPAYEPRPVSVRPYDPSDASTLYETLADERVWVHMSRPAPTDAKVLNQVITSRLRDGNRLTFTVLSNDRAVGVTSILFDPADPEGVEIGGTLLAPRVWGTGVNTKVKRQLLASIFRCGAQWVLLQTDERNERSAAAIRKLGATDLGSREEHLVRRDGSLRRSRIFRIERPGPTTSAR